MKSDEEKPAAKKSAQNETTPDETVPLIRPKLTESLRKIIAKNTTFAGINVGDYSTSPSGFVSVAPPVSGWSHPNYWSGVSPIRVNSEVENGLMAEITQLRSREKEIIQQLGQATQTSEKLKRSYEELLKVSDARETKERLRFILDRIETSARDLLIESKRFQQKFLSQETCDSYVMSIDIRRSTELMLKARTPQLFADFVGQLCQDLCDIILSRHGVFDKFTGDGILAFFPDFYTGDDAGYYALAAASDCHRHFEQFYFARRGSFSAVLKDVGLGIGIDTGSTHLVRLNDGLTVVGHPVVYACRMSGAPAGTTLLNQRAYDLIKEKYRGHCGFNEAEINVKHEGNHVAYSVRLDDSQYEPKPAGWLAFKGESGMRDETQSEIS